VNLIVSEISEFCKSLKLYLNTTLTEIPTTNTPLLKGRQLFFFQNKNTPLIQFFIRFEIVIVVSLNSTAQLYKIFKIFDYFNYVEVMEKF